MPHYPFVTVDVFTTKRFSGNPLAVITDARGLSTQQMQKIAAEFGYSETTFVFPPESAGHTAKVRIFTPVTEVPFAGHPNVGTAFVLGNRPEVFGRMPGDHLVFEEEAGIVHVELERQDGHVTKASIRAPRPLELGSEVDLDILARSASLSENDFECGGHKPLFLSVGLKFVVAEVKGLEALAAARPVKSVFEEGVSRYRHEETDFPLFLYTRMNESGTHLRARMFAPLDNVAEDPATGSASGALAAFLVARRPEKDGSVEIRIEQGAEMGRASEINLTVSKAAGTVREVRIGGACVGLMSGVIEI